jgi:LCP family protein required for cell wall assembly
MDESPVVWDPERRTFVRAGEPGAMAPDPTLASPVVESERSTSRPRRHVVIGPEHVGVRPGAADQSAASAPSAPSPPARRAAAPPPPPRGRDVPRTRPSPPPRRRAGGRRFVRIALVVVGALVLLALALFLFGWWQFSRIEKLPVSAALSSGGRGTNYLIVGSDSRAGIADDAPNAGAFLDGSFDGERTDTIMVLRMERSSSYLLSIPRDLWVQNPATGESGRINSVHQSGPSALITAVRDLGVPVHHYLEIDFVSFSRLVDAVGGITIDFAHPARDTNSGLDVPEAGPRVLNGAQALAYVRSRYYEELVDGQWRRDPTGDLGRVERQRAFLQGLMGEASGSRNPLTLANLGRAMGGGMRIDDRMTYFDALGLAWRLRGGFDPESVTLPVTPRTTSGGASVLELQGTEAQPVLSQFSG